MSMVIRKEQDGRAIYVGTADGLYKTMEEGTTRELVGGIKADATAESLGLSPPTEEPKRMRKGMLWLLIYLTLILFAASCGQNLPESYGVLAYTDKGRVPLNGQKVLLVGTLFQSITGLRGSSGSGYNSVKHFIAFGRGINPKFIRLAKLEFRKWGVVSNPFGNTTVDVNLWVAVKSIGLDIAPIDGKKDMYKLTPKENLAQGFYALHFGGLENASILEVTFGDVAFDFVVGDSSNYQSHEILEKRNEEEITAEAENLLRTMQCRP